MTFFRIATKPETSETGNPPKIEPYKALKTTLTLDLGLSQEFGTPERRVLALFSWHFLAGFQSNWYGLNLL